MTKAQKFTADLIEGYIKEGRSFQWRDISDQVKAKFTVKNWLTIRAVLQSFINEEKITRTRDVSVEEYVVTRDLLGG